MGSSAIAYMRVSAEEMTEDPQALVTQFDAVQPMAVERGWRTAAIAIDRQIESSVAPRERPGLGTALAVLSDGSADVLVVARLDRISHSVLTWAELLKRSCEQGWRVVVVDEGFDLSATSGAEVAAALAAVAREERRCLSANTRKGIAAAQARGTRLGRPVRARPRCAPPREGTPNRRRDTAADRGPTHR